MANIFKVKRSAVEGNIPTTVQLDLGEIAINTFDGKMFIKKDNGTPSVIEVGGGSGGPANGVFYENDTTITADYTITTNKNAMSAGPITINSGITVTVPAGSVWTIV